MAWWTSLTEGTPREGNGSKNADGNHNDNPAHPCKRKRHEAGAIYLEESLLVADGTSFMGNSAESFGGWCDFIGKTWSAFFYPKRPRPVYPGIFSVAIYQISLQ